MESESIGPCYQRSRKCVRVLTMPLVVEDAVERNFTQAGTRRSGGQPAPALRLPTRRFFQLWRGGFKLGSSLLASRYTYVRGKLPLFGPSYEMATGNLGAMI